MAEPFPTVIANSPAGVYRRLSIRYGNAAGGFDARSALMRFLGFLQRREIVILRDDPRLCGEILASSDTKGEFLEQLFATPAWRPAYSIESMDGEIWRGLARDFRTVLARLDWRTRLPEIIARKRISLRDEHPDAIDAIDAEVLARLVASVFHELLFEEPLSREDEDLYYRASIEWRREIAIKGRANAGVKREFWERLAKRLDASRFGDGLRGYADNPARWLSVFAQPFLLSPQINVGDILVAVFDHLRADPELHSRAREWARAGDRARLEGIALEAIRLRHPFPVLERELTSPREIRGRVYPAGTQVFILLDQFVQDAAYDPERWLAPASENPYAALPFAAGPRVCAGKPIALELLSELVRSFLVDFPDAAVSPAKGHLYSGRNNDGKTTLRETLYQLRLFARAIVASYRIGRGRPARVRTCPFSKKG